jgi:hypothetical protein
MSRIYVLGVELEVLAHWVKEDEFFEVLEVWYKGERQRAMEDSEDCCNAIDEALKEAEERDASDLRRYGDEP